MAMDKCKDMDEVKMIAKKKGLVAGRVRDTTDGIQFTKGTNNRLVVISWEEFEEYLKKRNLAVYRVAPMPKPNLFDIIFIVPWFDGT